MQGEVTTAQRGFLRHKILQRKEVSCPSVSPQKVNEAETSMPLCIPGTREMVGGPGFAVCIDAASQRN
jgi:hypothetical protein